MGYLFELLREQRRGVHARAAVIDAEVKVRARLRDEYNIEIAGGFGPLKGQIWRIGLMGESSTEAHVLTLLNALEALFMRGGWLNTPGVALQAASRIYTHVPC